METLKAPFPYFGGKSKVAGIVWNRFGDVRNYVEPFAGSLAVLLGRPHSPHVETVNDADGLLSNFWRALKDDPQAVAEYADWPANENDLHARHAWLVARKDTLQAKLEGDPDFYDAKVAGWWVWGICLWIGGGFCSGKGPWKVVKKDGARQLVHLGDAGTGIHRQLVHLGDAGRGIHRKLVHLGDAGRGIHRKRDAGRGAGEGACGLREWFLAPSDRLARVRICCGDWKRVCGPTPTVKHGLTGVFLDPPYASERASDIYRKDSMTVSHAVCEWAIEHGDDPLLRIALCGYEGEHKMPRRWKCVPWKAHGGYGNLGRATRGRDNCHRERIWFSPNCLAINTARRACAA